MKSKSLHEKIAIAFESDLKNKFHSSLPSLKSLASYYGVSYVTMSKAAFLLRAKGKIEYSRGRKLQTNGKESHNLTLIEGELKSAKIAKKIKKEIQLGIIPVGSVLPKLQYFASKFDGSLPTIAKAIKSLIQRGYIRKRGKHFYAGNKGFIQSEFSISHQSVIIILQHEGRHWRKICSTDRTRKFGEVFKQQVANANNIIIKTIRTKSSSNIFESKEASPEETFQQIAKLKNQYIGTLIISSPEELKDHAFWVKKLSSLKKPIIQLDRYGEMRTNPFKNKLFTICSFNEMKNIEIVTNAIYKHGHKNMVYFGNQKQEWSNKRYNDIKTCLFNKSKEASIEYYSLHESKASNLRGCKINCVNGHNRRD